jgi:hypothetical protein
MAYSECKIQLPPNKSFWNNGWMLQCMCIDGSLQPRDMHSECKVSLVHGGMYKSLFDMSMQEAAWEPRESPSQCDEMDRVTSCYFNTTYSSQDQSIGSQSYINYLRQTKTSIISLAKSWSTTSSGLCVNTGEHQYCGHCQQNISDTR